MHSAQRTLVKSPPELWAELSDADGLARRLAYFGEVRTTGLEPEDTVAWEGDRVRGTVRLEPSGWGTKVTLEVEPKEPPEPEPAPEAAAPEPEPEPEPDPEPEPEPVAEEPEPEVPRRRLFGRLFRRRTAQIPGPPAPPTPDPTPPTPTPDPGPPPPPDPTPPQIELDPETTVAALEAVLDDLGAAHHRPFSRG
jgi:hypothetical protein